MKERILIIDGLNFVYRGLVKFGNKKSKDENEEDASKKEPQYTIVYNFFRNLRALTETFEPDKIFLVLEGNPVFRKNLFPDYKKNRIVKTGSKKAEIKEDVLRQADIIFKLSSFLPITLVRAQNYEADDTIYALAKNLQNEEVIIVSSDSDLIQILQSLPEADIKLYHSGKKQFVEAPEYVYLVWKSIAGDTSDNIPSITSDDKATHLAQTPKALQEFLAVEENRADFSLNKQLIELQLVPDNELEFTEYHTNLDALFGAFEDMKLFSMITEKYKSKFSDTFEPLM